MTYTAEQLISMGYQPPRSVRKIKKARVRAKHSPGKMNDLEREYESRVLKPLLLKGEVMTYAFESVKFRLAKATFYTPDFIVVREDGIEAHEVKGHWEDDARVKIKVAQAMFPWITFIGVQKIKGSFKAECFE